MLGGCDVFWLPIRLKAGQQAPQLQKERGSFRVGSKGGMIGFGVRIHVLSCLDVAAQNPRTEI